MTALALIDAVIENHASFKKVGPKLESLPPDQHAVDRLVTAYRDGKIPGWLAVHLLGCVGHVGGYETGMSILLSNEGKSYAGKALVKMDTVRAFEDLRRVILSGEHPKVRRDAAYGLALYGSEQAINVFLTAFEEGRLPFNQVASVVAQCGLADATLLKLLRSPESRKQKLAFAVIDWLVSKTMQKHPPGKEVAELVCNLLREPSITMESHRREILSTWAQQERAL